MKILRTDPSRFMNLPDYPYAENYLIINDPVIGDIRVHYVDEGQKDAPIIFCLHGEPTWSYLYRHMIRIFVDAGYRVIAPDQVGFGKSDKPIHREDYTYANHVRWMSEVVTQLGLDNITLICQDWGGLIGLRLVAAMPERFARVSASNTVLVTGDQPLSEAFMQWQSFSQTDHDFNLGEMINQFSVRDFSAAEVDAYNAPFPTEEYKAGAREFPMLVPTTPDNVESQANREAWEVLEGFKKSFLTCFSDGDPVTSGFETFFQQRIPGCDNQPHIILENGGHFIQEDKGEDWANYVIRWIDGEL